MKAPNKLARIVRASMILVTVVALFGIGALYRVIRVDEPSGNGAGMDAAYRELLPERARSVHNRFHETRQVFTDGVERYRFDGADQELVDALVIRYRLSPADRLRESLFPAPSWWNPPDDGVTFLRGDGHQYVMLVYDPASGRVFFETTQD